MSVDAFALADDLQGETDDGLELIDSSELVSGEGKALDDALDPPTVRLPNKAAGVSLFGEPTEQAVVRPAPAPISFDEHVGIFGETTDPAMARATAQASIAPSGSTSAPSAKSISDDGLGGALFDETLQDAQRGADTVESLDPFAPQHTAKIHTNRLFRSATDAVVLGDAGDIAESVLAEQPDAGGDNDDFLTSATNAERRVFVPVLVHIGRDIAKNLRPNVVLREVPGAAARAPLSPFERFVLREVDGVRPVGRIQARLGVSLEDLHLALALLLDKVVLEPAGVVRQAGAAEPTPSQSTIGEEGTAAGAPPGVSGIHEAMTLELPEAIEPPPAGPTPAPARPADAAVTDDDTNIGPAPGSPRSPRSLLASMLDESPAKEGQPAPWSVPEGKKPVAPSALTMTSRRVGRGFVVADAGRSQAASLHDQCVRDIKNGEFARAWQLACMAQAAAPDDARYKELVDDWQNVVERYKTREDARLYAQAVRAESLGDIAKATQLLRAAVEHNPANAPAWNRLGLALAMNSTDMAGAVAALEKATALSPDDATYRSNLGKVVAAAERRGFAGLFRKIRR